jgi:hypothetical protein
MSLLLPRLSLLLLALLLALLLLTNCVASPAHRWRGRVAVGAGGGLRGGDGGRLLPWRRQRRMPMHGHAMAAAASEAGLWLWQRC